MTHSKIIVCILSGVALCAAVSACSTSKLHLVGEESGRKGDIQIADANGVAAWTWGEQQFNQKVDVITNDLIAGIAGGGRLTLKLQDGTKLEFAGEHGVLVCSSGCEEAHLPMAWRQIQ